MAYTYEEVYAHVLGEWNRLGRPRPILLGESGYERESNDGRGGSPFRVRRQAYQTVLAGGLGGHCYGHQQFWRFGDQWREALKDVGSRQMSHVKALFTSLPWQELVPDQHHELVVTGRELFGKPEYVVAARSKDGGVALAYFPATRPVTIDLGKLASPVAAQWFDPAEGTRKTIEGSPFTKKGTREFTPPGKNAAGDPDWVLVMRKGDWETESREALCLPLRLQAGRRT